MKNGNKKAYPLYQRLLVVGIAILAFIISMYISGGSDTQTTTSETEVVVETESDTDSNEEVSVEEDDGDVVDTTVNETDNEDNELETVIEDDTDDEKITDDAIAYVFRNEKLLQQHYEKHGIEMGFDSAESYEAAASAVVNNPDALHKTEQEDGDDVYYLEDTNEFVIVSTDGYLRTYFNPGAGKAYFDRQ